VEDALNSEANRSVYGVAVQQDNRLFAYYNIHISIEGTLYKGKEYRWERPYTYSSMSLEALVTRVKAASECRIELRERCEYVYFSAPLEEAMPGLHATLDADGVDAFLWIGSAGVVAQRHYDEDHNLFFQLKG
jgi:hypothetical protein